MKYPPQIESLKRIMKKDYFWLVYNKSEGKENVFVDIVKCGIEKDQAKAKNVYKGMVVTNKLF